jgi:dimethylamine/trimethylamine dehydrogenase
MATEDYEYGDAGIEIEQDGMKFIAMADPLVDLWDIDVGDIAACAGDSRPTAAKIGGHLNSVLALPDPGE